MTTEGIDWPAWVQAVGTVLALFLAGGLAVWEAHRRRLEDRARVADQLSARVAVLEFACDSAASFLEEHLGDGRQAFVRATWTYEATRNALAIAETVSVLDMPTKAAVDAYFIYTAGAKIYRDVVDQNSPEWLKPHDISRLAGPLGGMRNGVNAIKAEAERLARGG